MNEELYQALIDACDTTIEINDLEHETSYPIWKWVCFRGEDSDAKIKELAQKAREELKNIFEKRNVSIQKIHVKNKEEVDESCYFLEDCNTGKYTPLDEALTHELCFEAIGSVKEKYGSDLIDYYAKWSYEKNTA